MRLTSIFIFLMVCSTTYTQTVLNRKNYLGIQPAFLAEPYDTIKALEVNIVPINYERRFEKDWSLQLRSIVNYRFYELGPGVSQVGGTFLVNKYFPNMIKEDFWITPVTGLFNTSTYNRLDLITTLTFGAEVGVLFSFGELFSLSTTLQPGINYYPNEYSQNFVGTSSGFKSHFGVIVHGGINFGR